MYNDTYGHQQGDACLKAVSDVFLTFNEHHKMSFYRYGGEEFLAVIWKGETQTPLTICQDLLQHVLNLNLKHEKSPLNQVTISLGYSLASTNQTLKNLISQADTALYESKNKGRNQISSY